MKIGQGNQRPRHHFFLRPVWPKCFSNGALLNSMSSLRNSEWELVLRSPAAKKVSSLQLALHSQTYCPQNSFSGQIPSASRETRKFCSTSHQGGVLPTLTSLSSRLDLLGTLENLDLTNKVIVFKCVGFRAGTSDGGIQICSVSSKE